MAKTQRADLHQRADALLDAAAGLLGSVGPRGLRIEEVARRAGVGKGTVYLHWASREHLLLAIGAREAAAMYEAVTAAIRIDPVEAALHRYLRRLYVEAMQRPILRSIFIADEVDLAAFANQPTRSDLTETKLIAAGDHLAALRDHRLLRSGIDPADVDHAVQAIAYGFFADSPLASGPRFSLEHRADLLAEVIRRSFEPARTPAPERYAAAAPSIIEASERLAASFGRIAYGTAAD
ncbi:MULTISPECIES: TetR/AcrR family transcriptional regulator [Glycomyces]|uniref:AcrR family transcriptional regulator n=2 Tax=Glycomyces TaxID=58113 RepID=A0A9X3PNR6_9ACTN|nr:TetR/AcrR family transcriptional regulator [Glycomyces lechevalierae]MDA1388377.1 helix-turn-helix domain containing protein [Glycomyces lechevalierae]MDR7340332.1 AcrR family transcriptional regulator [Glycomyces lechevalierae]